MNTDNELQEGYEDEVYEAVAVMTKTAEDFGLLVEVVSSFGDHCASGLDIVNAAGAALYDWDI